MPRFTFSLRDVHQVREAGMVQTDSFTEALDAISEHLSAKEGDTLEIGVSGFPPALYTCIRPSDEETASGWLPSRQLAA